MRVGVEVLILVVILAVVILPEVDMGQVETPDIEFPYVLRIAEGNVLVVHGRVFRDSVTFTWAPDDSLRIEGLAVMPAPAMPPKTYTEERLAEVYGDVPFIVDLVDKGYTWDAAVQQYDVKILQIRSWMLATYRAVLDSTGSHEKARKAVLDSVDRSLFEDGAAPWIGESMIKAPWAGGFVEFIPLKEPEPFTPPPEEIPSPKEKAIRYTVSASRWLDRPGATPWVAVVDRRGIRGMSGSNAYEAIDQIENAGRGEFVDGPLDEFTLEEIILKRMGE
jgi:hypothetical protein